MQTGTRPPVTADVTRQLARHIAISRYADRPAGAVAAARRGVLDWLGRALAGKFMLNAEPMIGRERAARACELTAALKKQPGIRELLRLCA